jgi:aryl-alcohol dehydrogenase-like predicted oxidoreductase
MVHAGHFGPTNDSDSLAAIDAAFDLGVNFIDTSDAYGAGYSETLLGKALKGRRDKVILATKGGNTMVGPNRGKRDFSSAYINRVMDESLKRLQTDAVDLYHLHNPTVEVIEQGEVWELLERRKKEGKIRHLGVSINSVAEGIAAVKDGRSDVMQVEYNIFAQDHAKEVFPMAQKANIGVIARVPLRRGLLSGKMTLADQKRFQDDDVRVRQFAGDVLAQELRKVELLQFLVRGPVKSIAQAALGFCLAHPAVGVVIPGARNAQQMRENAAAADIKLPSEDLQKIAELWRNGFKS